MRKFKRLSWKKFQLIFFSRLPSRHRWQTLDRDRISVYPQIDHGVMVLSHSLNRKNLFVSQHKSEMYVGQKNYWNIFQMRETLMISVISR